MAEDDGSAETLNLIVVVEEAPSAPSYVSVEAPPEAPPYVSVEEVVTRLMHVFGIDGPSACMEFLYQQQHEAGVDFEGKRSPHSPWEKITTDYWLACEYVNGGFVLVRVSSISTLGPSAAASSGPCAGVAFAPADAISTCGGHRLEKGGLPVANHCRSGG
jgi:hypothetical protein